MPLYEATTSYSAPFVKVDEYWARGITGKGIKVGIVDDGISDKHPALDVYGGLACGSRTTYYSEIDHGNHCAGIVAAKDIGNGEPVGIAPGVHLYSIRMAYSTTEERVQSVIDSVYFAIENDLDILSMSIHLLNNAFGWTPETSSTGPPGVPKHMRTSMRKAFKEAMKNDVVIVVAAGNNNDGSGEDNMEFTEYLPKMPGVIAVANFDAKGNRRGTSGVGKWVDVAAYGVLIRSTSGNSGYTTMSGTSMATPMVAGILSLYIEHYRAKGLSNRDALNEMLRNCEPFEGVPRNQQGRGVPQPSDDILSKPVLKTYKSPLRVYAVNKWQAVKPYYKVGSTWKEMEAHSNG